MSGSSGTDDRPQHIVEWTATALRGLDRLPEKAATAVVELVFGAIATDPFRVGHALNFELEGARSARRGPYRVIYLVAEELPVVTILAVAHRRDVYRRR